VSAGIKEILPNDFWAISPIVPREGVEPPNPTPSIGAALPDELSADASALKKLAEAEKNDPSFTT